MAAAKSSSTKPHGIKERAEAEAKREETKIRCMERLTTSRALVDAAEQALTQAYENFYTDVRDSFAAGLSVVPIHEATGMTPSRLYQIKAGRRT